jgi:hypothetical protein
MNNNLKIPLEKLPSKKRLIMNASVVCNFSRAIDPYQKNNVPQTIFVENLGLLVV